MTMRKLMLLSCLLIVLTTQTEGKTGGIRFGLCTDVHIPTMHDSESRITRFIDDMKKAKPDFILEMGDFATPDPKFARCFEIWNSFPGPKYHVIGNHEMDGGYKREQTMAFLGMKSSYYSFDQNEFHFIVLDGNDKKNPEAKGYKQFIGAAQAEWLRQDLAATRYPVVIFSHQGLVEYQSEDETYGVENWKDIRKMLNDHNNSHPGKRVVACFNGHTHYDDAVLIDGIWFITITSMSYHWLGEKYAHPTFGVEVDKHFKWIQYTAPFKDPLYTIVEITPKGLLKVAGKKSQWVGATPAELGYQKSRLPFMRPEITRRRLKLTM
ncbi:MAG: metallophosphoesterase [Marinilabiliales bacterium]|nr:metallophosphoesterase [Marinilabiliales bacterium]